MTPARAQTAAAPVPGHTAGLIDDIVIGSRVFAEFGVLDGFGHVSARDPANPGHFLLGAIVDDCAAWADRPDHKMRFGSRLIA